MIAIVTILKQHLLLNSKSDKAETWLEAVGRSGDSELPNSSNHVCSRTVGRIEFKLENRSDNAVMISKMASILAVLKIFKPYLLLNGKSD